MIHHRWRWLLFYDIIKTFFVILHENLFSCHSCWRQWSLFSLFLSCDCVCGHPGSLLFFSHSHSTEQQIIPAFLISHHHFVVSWLLGNTFSSSIWMCSEIYSLCLCLTAYLIFLFVCLFLRFFAVDIVSSSVRPALCLSAFCSTLHRYLGKHILYYIHSLWFAINHLKLIFIERWKVTNHVTQVNVNE